MRNFKKTLKDERGQSLVLVALALIVLLGMTAFSVDAGYLFFEKRNMQNAADAASLAGARELRNENVTGEDVYGQVKNYIVAHNLSEDDILNKDEIKALTSADTHVSVVLRGNKGLFFARVFDIVSANVSAKATAKIGPLVAGEGLVPIALTEEQFVGATEGQNLNLIDFHIIGAANWGVVSFTGQGTGQTPPVISDYIRNGYPGTIRLGDPNVYTAPGAAGGGAQGDVNDAIVSRIGETVFVPVVKGSVNGSKWIEVVGFAAVQITEITGSGANIGVKGKFVKSLGIGPVGGTTGSHFDEYGVYGVALVE